MPKVQHAADKLSPAPIYIDETANLSVLELRSKARRHMAQYGCDLIIVDYIQLMSSGRRVESRQVEMSEISRSIKALARELHVPVMALSQLSREAERDEEGIPKLQHLRESGAIEQDADVVLMLARIPVRKQEKLQGKYGHDINVDNILQLAVAKQRNGPTGEVNFFFDRNMQRFGELGPASEERAYGGPGRGGADYEESYESEEAGLGEDVPF
jgi:replicative DNA helicase